MTSEQRAAAVYDAMMARCPDCHHPWSIHVSGDNMRFVGRGLIGCLFHRFDGTRIVVCECTNNGRYDQ